MVLVVLSLLQKFGLNRFSGQLFTFMFIFGQLFTFKFIFGREFFLYNRKPLYTKHTDDMVVLT